MIHALAAHRQEIENELRERILALFAENDEAPDSVSIEMKLSDAEDDGLSIIHILVKEMHTPALG